MDALIGALEVLTAKKRAVKQAAMQQLLTGRTRLPGFGGEWETRRLGELAKMASGGTPPTSVGTYYDGGILPWVSINDMTSGGGRVITKTERTLSRLGLDNSAARLFPVGTVLCDVCVLSVSAVLPGGRYARVRRSLAFSVLSTRYRTETHPPFRNGGAPETGDVFDARS